MPDFVDRTKPVRKGEELDVAAVKNFLIEAVPGLRGELVIEQFPSGHSNLTYMIKVGEREMVLRRPPFGSKVKSAHDMGREFRVLSAIHPVYGKAPKPLAFCEDDSIIGAKFYVMERIRGVILRKELPPGMIIDDRTASGLCESMIQNLAEIHAVDYAKAGLGEFGKPAGYLTRQVNGWADRYYGSQTDDIPGVESTIQWLKQNLPESPPGTLIQNDYKYDNIVLDATDLTKIIGVLDWEMSTIGDPLCDLGAAISYWVQADDPEDLRLMAFGPTMIPGSWTRQQLADRYAELTGRDVSNIMYYAAFGTFKLLVIIQQIYYRFAKGCTQDDRFGPMIDLVKLLDHVGREIIERGHI
jgi:aminoglycoside phosphotransferase (APT) family kinase protein